VVSMPGYPVTYSMLIYMSRRCTSNARYGSTTSSCCPLRGERAAEMHDLS
jgi:hypothetical protein